MLAWFDCETTGLKPHDGSLLEVACLITDDDLQPLDAGVTILVQPLMSTLERMDKVVVDMHTQSGLLMLIENKTNVFRRYEAEEILRRYLDGHTAKSDGTHEKIPLAGSSIHFDRAWLKVHMEDLEERFSYRNIDVSTVKELCKRWAPRVYEMRRQSLPAHRAMLDVVASIDELRWYREHFLRVDPWMPLVPAIGR